MGEDVKNTNEEEASIVMAEGWNSLMEVREDWDEHLNKANQLKGGALVEATEKAEDDDIERVGSDGVEKAEDDDIQEKRYSYFEDLLSQDYDIEDIVDALNDGSGELVENLAALLQNGADVNRIQYLLSSEELLNNLDLLLDYGLEIDGDILIDLMDLPDDKIFDNLEPLLRAGASTESVMKKMNFGLIVENLGLLMDYGASIDLDKMLETMTPYEAGESASAIFAHGSREVVQKLFQKLTAQQIADHFEDFLARGFSVDEILCEIPESVIVGNLNTFLAGSIAIEDYVYHLGLSAILKNLDLLNSKGAQIDIRKLFEQRPGNYELVANLDTLLANGISIDEIVERLDPVIVADKFIELSQKGAHININKIACQIDTPNIFYEMDHFKSLGFGTDIDVEQPREEVFRDINMLKAGYNLEFGEFREARANLAKAVYDVRFGSLCRDLVAFGIVDFNDNDRVEMREAHEDPERFYEQHFSRIGNIKMQNLDSLIDNSEISIEDAMMLHEATFLMTISDDRLQKELDFFKRRRQDLAGTSMGDLLKSTREKLCQKSAEVYSEYMDSSVKGGAANLDPITYAEEGKTYEIPVERMEGDEWMMLVHRLGGVMRKTDDWLMQPENWDNRAPRQYDVDGKPLGYISTSAIGDSCIDTAGSDEISPIVYGFTNLPKDSFLGSAEYDLYMGYENPWASYYQPLSTRRQDFFYTNPHTIVERTRERLDSQDKDEGYNEVALNRYPGGGASEESRLRPNYLVVFSDSVQDIPEMVKKHAAYFGTPIMLIDPKRYGRRQNEQ